MEFWKTVIILLMVGIVFVSGCNTEPGDGGKEKGELVEIVPAPVGEITEEDIALFEVDESECLSGKEAVPKIGFSWKWGEIDDEFCQEKVLDETQFSICLLKQIQNFRENFSEDEIGFCGDKYCNEEPLSCPIDCQIAGKNFFEGNISDFEGLTENLFQIDSIAFGASSEVGEVEISFFEMASEGIYLEEGKVGVTSSERVHPPIKLIAKVAGFQENRDTGNFSAKIELLDSNEEEIIESRFLNVGEISNFNGQIKEQIKIESISVSSGTGQKQVMLAIYEIHDKMLFQEGDAFFTKAKDSGNFLLKFDSIQATGQYGYSAKLELFQDPEEINNFFEFEANLMRLNFSKDFRNDFHEYYTEKNFLDTPIYYPKEGGLGELFSDPEKLIFTASEIEKPGKYNIKLSGVLATEGSVVVEFEHLDSAEFIDNAFYYLNFNGPIGETENGVQREGYGLGYSSINETIRLNQDFSLQPSDIGTGAFELDLQKISDNSSLNLDTSTRGVALKVKAEPRGTKREVRVAHTIATPLLLKSKVTDVSNTDSIGALYNIFTSAGQEYFSGDSLLLWQPIGEQCVDFSGSDNWLYDVRNEGDPLAYMLHYNLSSVPESEKISGDVYHKTVFYSTDLYSITGLGISKNNRLFKKDLEIKSPIAEREVNEPLSLNGTPNSLHNNPENKTTNFEEIFKMVKEGLMCIQKKGDTEQIETTIRWNEEKLFEFIGTQIETAQQTCAVPPAPYEGSAKDLSLYSEKEVFLISNKNWKEFLPWVPVTTWTGNETDCQRGTGTPEDVCVYPTLIYHEEKIQTLDLSDSFYDLTIFEKNNEGVGNSIYYTEGIEFEYWFEPSIVSVGESTTYKVKIKNERNTNLEINEVMLDWYYTPLKEYFGFKFKNDEIEFLKIDKSLAPGEELIVEFFPFEYQKQIKGSFDADSIIYFLQQYSPNRVTIIGTTPPELEDLLIAEQELGAGLELNQLQRINPENYWDYWKSFDTLVYVEDNYSLALLASTYASLINSPLIIEGTNFKSENVFNNKNVICVGNVSKNCSVSYNLDELQREYFEKTKTNKLILTNPNDLKKRFSNGFFTDKSSEVVFDSYSKTSLAAPILASAKHELILENKSEDYAEIDDFFTKKLEEYYTIPNRDVKTCNAGQNCSSDFDGTITKDIFFTENSARFEIPFDIKSDESITIRFEGIFFDCGSEPITVELYNNGKFLDTINKNCQDVETLLMGAHYYTTYFGDFKSNNIERGELELRFENASFAINPAGVFEIYSWSQDEDGLTEKVEHLFICRSLEEACAPEIMTKNINGVTSEKITTFSFENIDPKLDYSMEIKIIAEDIEKVIIYVNDVFFEEVEYYHYYADKKIFDISDYLVGENITIKLEPVPFEDDIFNEPRYFANISLKSKIVIPSYLTIIGSPNAIPMSIFKEKGGKHIEVDGRIYASINNHQMINLPVGRIMGITLSDVSAYISRDLFFEKLEKNKDALLVVREDHQSEIREGCEAAGIEENCTSNEKILEEYARTNFWTEEIAQEFGQEFFYSGHNEVAENEAEIHKKYSEVYLNLFDDHGSTFGFAGMMDVGYLVNNQVYLKPSFTIAVACSTCAYDTADRYGFENSLFCMQGIRRGALAQQGAVDVSYWHQEFDDILNNTILNNQTIGEAYMNARNAEFFNDQSYYGIKGDVFYVLLGDPTWKPKWW